nr:hypothetical protein [Methylobacterium sp. ZNC0032]
MKRRKEGGRLRRVRFQRAVAILAIMMTPGSAALASDADLQRALLDSRCAAPRIETMPERHGFVAYRANCLGTSHKVITIVCGKGRCSPSPSSDDRGRP